MDWRTRDRHDAKDVADRPLYPVDDEHHQQDEQINLHPEPLPTPPVAAQPDMLPDMMHITKDHLVIVYNALVIYNLGFDFV